MNCLSGLTNGLGLYWRPTGQDFLSAKSSFTLVIVFLMGLLQRTLYQVARPVLEYRVDSFFSCVLYSVRAILDQMFVEGACFIVLWVASLVLNDQ